MLDKMKDEVDMSVLDEIIKLAESAMVRPFNKKKEEEEALPEGEGGEEMLADDDGAVPSEGEDDDLSDEDLEALMESYKRG